MAIEYDKLSGISDVLKGRPPKEPHKVTDDFVDFVCDHPKVRDSWVGCPDCTGLAACDTHWAMFEPKYKPYGEKHMTHNFVLAPGEQWTNGSIIEKNTHKTLYIEFKVYSDDTVECLVVPTRPSKPKPPKLTDPFEEMGKACAKSEEALLDNAIADAVKACVDQTKPAKVVPEALENWNMPVYDAEIANAMYFNHAKSSTDTEDIYRGKYWPTQPATVGEATWTASDAYTPNDIVDIDGKPHRVTSSTVTTPDVKSPPQSHQRDPRGASPRQRPKEKGRIGKFVAWALVSGASTAIGWLLFHVLAMNAWEVFRG